MKRHNRWCKGCKQYDGISSSQPSDVIRLTSVMLLIAHVHTDQNGDCIPRMYIMCVCVCVCVCLCVCVCVWRTQ